MASVTDLFAQTGGAALDSFWQTPAGQNMLQQIQDRAKAGVTDAASANAINLMLFALAGGAIGGTLFKGPIGTVAAAVLAFWAGNRILANVQAPAPVQGLGGAPVQGLGMARVAGYSNKAQCVR